MLLAFHGYGEEAGVFAPLLPYLADELTVLSFDLPHHGISTWGNTIFSKHLLRQLVRAVMAMHKVDKVSLLGFSMGGRVCLSLVEMLPGCIDKVVLLAPDGLVRNNYYNFFAGTAAGRSLFRHVLTNPGLYSRVLEWAHKAGLVHASRYKFAMNYVSTPQQRGLLLKVWPTMSDLVPTLSRLTRAIRDHNIPVELFMGANDRIMPPALGKQFKEGLDTVQLHILDRGHRVFDHDNAADIARSF